jgi:hypothetical protein
MQVYVAQCVALDLQSQNLTPDACTRTELLNKSGAFDRIAGVKTFSEGKD